MQEKLRRYSFVVLMIVMCLPIIFWTPLPGSHSIYATTTPGISLYFSALAGYIGAVFMLFEYALGTRAVLRYFLKDIPGSIKLHSFLGIYGTLIVFLHPILVTIGYGESWLYSFLPRLSPEFEQHVTYGRIAFVLLLLIWVTSALVKGKIAYRPWKYIHYLSYVILPFTLIHATFVGSAIKASRPLQYYWYFLAALFLILFCLRLLQYFNFTKRGYRVIGHTKIANNVYALRLRAVNKAMSIRAGQYVHLQQTLFGEEHPFSVLDFNDKTNELMISYKVFGRFSQKLTKLAVGDYVLLDGPYGTFTTEISNRPVAFIAGGIGVTPFVRHIMRADTGNIPYLFYCNQNRDSAAFRQQLSQKLGSRYIDIFSKETPAATKNIEYGHLESAHLIKYLPDPLVFDFYICGPKGLTKTAAEYLAHLGVPFNQIHVENFTF